jgi:hypothetical protein
VKVLYCCPEYYVRHGGRIHACGFFGALQRLPSVLVSFLLPKVTAVPRKAMMVPQVLKKSKLWFLPPIANKIV